jgi:signal transduction histidine kinase
MIFRKTLPFILCCCLSASLSAQTPLIDSLRQSLYSFKGSDYDKGLLMLDISQKYRGIDTAMSRMYNMEALRLAQGKKLVRLEGNAYFYLANYYTGIGQFYKAHIHFKKAEKLLLGVLNKYQMCGLYLSMMQLFETIEDLDNIEYYADKILEIASERYDLTTVTPLPSDTLDAVDLPANFTTIIFYAQILKGEAHFNNNWGEEALEYYLEMYRKSISHPIPVSSITSKMASGCGLIYTNLNRPREALHYLHLVREDYEKRQPTLLPLIFHSIAEAYAMLHQTDSAEYYMKKAGDSFLTDAGIKMTTYRTRSLLEAGKGNHRNALETYKKYHHLSDSIARAGKTTEMARLRNWLEFEQKDNENMILLHEKQKQRKLIWILAVSQVLIFVLLGLSVFLYRKVASQNREMKELHGVKDKLFSVVAHDLRSPLSSLITMLKLVNENRLNADMQAQLMRDITNRVDSTFGLLDNLLRWAKSQMQGMIPAPVYFDAQEASFEVTNAIEGVAAGKKIVLNNRIEKQQIYADRDMFAVLVRNLTTNAIKYTPAEGYVTIASELKDNMLIISVKDTGTGMPPEVQDKLFKLSETKSQRGTNNESGTGLGLVLCADFVKINGGKIWFTSKEGEGSTFYFSVPVK